MTVDIRRARGMGLCDLKKLKMSNLYRLAIALGALNSRDVEQAFAGATIHDKAVFVFRSLRGC